MMPGAMNPNAGMSDQEQQMVKAVCTSISAMASRLPRRAVACLGHCLG